MFQMDQLHKIYKLCGPPADDYWNKSIFNPHFPYRSVIRDVFQGVPEHALSLLETLLSVDPYNRGTASYALASEVRFRHVVSYIFLLYV
jgi:hypothetical protein